MERITTTTQFTTSNEIRMVLRPATINIRNEFQNFINNRIRDNNPRLPSTFMLESVSVIDRETILEINNSTSSKRKIKLMRSIQNNKNINDNSYFLIANNSNQI